MYCPRCNIEVENEEFCEKCGRATVASSEVAATTTLQAKITEPIREELKINKIKVSKFNFKKIVSSIAFLAICIGIFIGYSVLKDQYTPRRTVEKYYTYLLNKDYDNAYKLLIGTDSNFLTKDNFEKSMESMNLKSYNIKNYNPNEFSFDERKSNFNATNNMFSVQAEEKLFPIEIQKDGKKLLFFDDYKISTDSFTTKWEFTAPKGASITIDGKEANVTNEISYDNNSFMIGSSYKADSCTYSIDNIFNGTYDVNVTMDGAKDFKASGAVAGKKLDIKFETTDELAKQLQDQAKEFLDLHYSNATQDKYSGILTPDSKVLSKTNQFGLSSNQVINKLQDIKITKQSIDDLEHVKISVSGTISYEDSSLVQWGLNKSSGTKEINVDFYFEKQDGKWLISDTSYIS
ncbi:hypothetical protein FDB24_16745 [Clostridium botulinum]|uniref:hypothetical protein n=1 Tax=Clostridium botulinum TaxID=1491 RepID=UPI000774DD67|nr:hypothetical protein [Clostridium botulinum]NFL88146.1 hypothetical protein [Clostridium botulinum]NFO22861.1 hypothetical protein [Clostridium botulinum]